MTVSMNPSTLGQLPPNVQQVIRESIQAGKPVAAEQLVNAIAEDGLSSDAEKELLSLIKTSVDGRVSFDDGEFEGSTVTFENIDPEQLKTQVQARLKQVQRLDNKAGSTMAYRANTFRQIQTADDLKRALEADQKIAGQNDGQRTLHNTGAVAGKILLQDAVLLQKTGLLSPEEKSTLTDLVTKVQQAHSIAALKPADVLALDQMVENALQKLAGGDVQIQSVDAYTLRSLQEIEDLDQRVDVVRRNYDALMDGSVASGYDLSNAVNEVGMSDYQMKAFRAGTSEKGEITKKWANQDVELGRSFTRISDAINEVSTQIGLIENQAVPTLEAQIQNLDQKLVAAAKTIKPELADLSDPEILQEIGLDPLLQHALGEDFSQKRELMNKMVGLQSNLSDLHSARVSGLKNLSTLKTIYSEKEERVSSVNLMQSKLVQASGRMAELENQINSISVQDGAVHEALQRTGQALEKLKGPDGAKVTQKLIEQMGLKDIGALSQEVSQIRDNMISGMQDVLKVYDETRTANPRAKALIQEQIATLQALKTEDPGMALGELGRVRQNLMTELKKMVPSAISLEEYHALTGLDKEVGHFANATHHNQTLIQVKQEMIEEQIKEALDQQQNAASKTTSMLSKFSDEYMAYDTHVNAEVKLLIGLGGKVGPAEVFAGAGVTGSIYVGKRFGMAPAYRAMADLDFTAEVRAKIPKIVEFEYQYRSTIASAGVAFNTMDEAKKFLGDYADMVATKAKLELMKLDPISDNGAAIQEMETEYTRLKATVDKSIADHSCSNDRTRHSFSAKLPFVDKALEKMHLHGHGSKIEGSSEENIFTFTENGETKQVKDHFWRMRGELNHNSFTFFSQNSAELDASGQPTGHSKTRQGFHIGIGSDQVQKLLKSGSKLSDDMANTLAGKVVDMIGPEAGLTVGMVAGLLQNRWTEFTQARAADMARLTNASNVTGKSGMHEEFVIGVDWVLKDDKLQYIALEAGYEAEFKAGGGFNFGTSPVRMEAEFKLDSEVALMYKVYKSDSYKASTVQDKLDQKLPGMNLRQQLAELAAKPELASKIGVGSYIGPELDTIRKQNPQLQGKSDTEVLSALLLNESLAEGTFLAYMLQKSTAAKP